MEKTLHFIWYQGISNAPGELQDMPRKWAAMNPEYRVKVWDEKEIQTFIANSHPNYYSFFQSIGFGESRKIQIIKRCDFARLLILFSFGGAYVDLDCLPIRPIRLLFQGGLVEHRHTPFTYGRNGTLPSTLQEKDAKPVSTNFDSYELIVSREHLANPTIDGFTITNAVMFGKAGSSLINEMIVGCATNAKEKVLSFAGPLGLSRYLIARLHSLQGRVLALPPYYFLWQKHDMGAPWKNTICCHLNRMDWVDWTSGNPTPWHV